jgi:SAM-dependent methyltransferase
MTTPPHLGGASLSHADAFTWMPDIWERLIVEYGIKSMLDIGCGAGWTTQWFLDHGVHALGIEGDPGALAARCCDPIISHDFTTGPWEPRDRYSFGWSSEFVEHVEEQFISNWMRALQACQYACITFATPGQGGHHHVCERDEAFWLERFSTAGFDHVPEETAKLRATSKGETWGRRTLTFFRNREWRP